MINPPKGWRWIEVGEVFSAKFKAVGYDDKWVTCSRDELGELCRVKNAYIRRIKRKVK